MTNQLDKSELEEKTSTIVERLRNCSQIHTGDDDTWIDGVCITPMMAFNEIMKLIDAYALSLSTEARIDELNRAIETDSGTLILRELLIDADSGTSHYGDTISRDDRIAELKSQEATS